MAQLFKKEDGPPLTVQQSRRQYGPILDAAAQKYGIPEALVRAVAYVESRWNPQAKSGVGAVGIMQIMPGTAEGLGVKDRTDPKQSAEGGAKLLAALYKRAGSWPVAIAAYNWGQGNVFGTGGKAPKTSASEWPSETQTYVQDVLNAQARGVV